MIDELYLDVAIVKPDKSMYCFGGYDGSYRNDFHEFNFGAYGFV